MENVKESYTAFHELRNPFHVYPTEWVIRTFLGSYPELSLDKTKYAKAKLLNMGFGDGRDYPLLENLGFELFGVEITERIIELTRKRMNRLGIKVNMKVGTNAGIPFEDEYFDYILAVSSCYYIDSGTTFENNITEYNRVLKPGGFIIASLPRSDLFYFKDCEELGDDHVRIVNDPFNIRNGYVLKRFNSEQDIIESFGKYFTSFSFGQCLDNYYGLQHNLFLVVCSKSKVILDVL